MKEILISILTFLLGVGVGIASFALWELSRNLKEIQKILDNIGKVGK
jgi:hypothetical protein